MIWLDAHLSPRAARFIAKELGRDAVAIRDIGLQQADDADIYEAARKERVVFITKDKDFTDLATRLGPPPHVILLTCGNTTEQRLKEVFTEHLESALDLIENSGESLVEISGD